MVAVGDTSKNKMASTRRGKRKVENKASGDRLAKRTISMREAADEGTLTNKIPHDEHKVVPLNDRLQDTHYEMQTSNISPSGNAASAKVFLPVAAHHSVLPLSMQIMKPFMTLCERCSKYGGYPHQRAHADFNFENTLNTILPTNGSTDIRVGDYLQFESTPSFIGKDGKVVRQAEETAPEEQKQVIDRSNHLDLISPTPKNHTLAILQEYRTAVQMFGCAHINPGVMTAIRFSLPTLRVSGSFHDADMLALCEVLLRHCNGALRHIQRLDFSIAGRFGKLHGRKGFGSHGAFTLSRVLCISKHIEEVILRKNPIGGYGASAIFSAASKNESLKNLSMRSCHVGEKGGFAFVEYISKSATCGLRKVDLSVNGIGFEASFSIEELLIQRENDGMPIEIDLDGNLVIQESKSLCSFRSLIHNIGWFPNITL